MIKIVKGKNASHKTPDFSENSEILATDCQNCPRFRHFRPSRQDVCSPHSHRHAGPRDARRAGLIMPVAAG
jgi:hypothetical protein